MDFSTLKKNSKSAIDKLTEELSKLNQKTSYAEDDDRFWYPAVDKSGNGNAIIRFLPPAAGEDVPFVRLFSHGFQGPTGKWYINNSLTTIGQSDPVGELNSKLWDSGLESNKEIARKQKRKLNFISNIYVIKDPANPENEGKVFLFKYGKKIFDKLNEMMNPSFADDPKVNPFDFWTGANFRIRIRTVDKYRNYDKSDFESPGPLLDDDKKLEGIWKQEHSLKAFVAPDQFKPYEKLKAELNRVLGEGVANDDEAPKYEETAPTAKVKAAPAESFDEAVSSINLDDEDDDSFARFQELAEKA